MLNAYRVETLEELRDDSRSLLRGAIDVHVHAAPDPYAERRMDARELVQAACEAGLAALVLKATSTRRRRSRGRSNRSSTRSRCTGRSRSTTRWVG